MKTVFIDIDGVTLDLGTEWLRRYNEDYNDNLSNKDILSWDTHKYVKPECGKKIYDYLLQPDIYEKVEPIPGALEAIEEIRKAYKVVFLSSGLHVGKYHRLQELGFLPKNHHLAQKEIIFSSDKSIVTGFALIDDNTTNVSTFQGHGILFDQKWNENFVWRMRVEHWRDAPKHLEALDGYQAARASSEDCK